MIGTTANNRYRLDAEVGRGGMGAVYRAHDSTLDRDVAIKMVSGLDLDTQGQARLLQEAQAIAKLNRPNIVSVYDAGQIDGGDSSAPYIVMELGSLLASHERGEVAVAFLREAEQEFDSMGVAYYRDMAASRISEDET